MLLTICLYPAEWRARYGNELRALISETDVRASDVADLVAGAMRARLLSSSRPTFHHRLGGAHSMLRRSADRAQMLAMIGFALILPSTVLVGVAILKYIFGIAAPFDALEPTHPSSRIP